MNTAMQQRIESGMTIGELVASHIAEFSKASKMRIGAKQLESLLRYHQKEVREFNEYHAAKARIAAFNSEYDAKYPD